ncbi:MAG: substrate-binding domain-containing protein, partial [Pirellulales bacterium]|nr:substrate-binding domain-containing protein [Pirellulales bacterium]
EEHSQVIVSTTNNDPIRQGNAILQLMSKDVAGVAIVPTVEPAPAFQIEMLQNQGIPVVFCHRRMQGTRAPLIAIPYRDVGRMAGRELLKQGHRRVAMYFSLPFYRVLPKPGTNSTRSGMDYAIGLREVLRQGGCDLPDEMILAGDSYSLDQGLQEKEAWPKIKKLFSRPDRPTAIMTSYDTMGEIVYLALERLGLRVPEDVSVLSFGGKQRRGAIVRRLTSVTIDGEDIGRRAARLLNEIANGQRSIYDTEEIIMPLGLSDGQSLGLAKVG